jgi:flavin reductase (DIM6/NTAB) family NADH-FMN oxidoreductase RutF/rubredoxin
VIGEKSIDNLWEKTYVRNKYKIVMLDKDAFFKLSYGIYLVCSSNGDTRNAYIANTVFQVSSEPPMFAISCHKDNYTAELISSSGFFSFSILQKYTPLEFIQKFGYKSAKEEKDKFRRLNYKKGKSGCPVVYDNSVCYFECKVTKVTDVGTHQLIVGEVIDNGMLDRSEEVLTYKHYREVYKASSPSKAPTFVNPDKEIRTGIEDDPKFKQFACTICEYVYNPSKGDPINGLDAGTSFDDIPDDWVCPICGAGKMLFTEI